MFACGALSFCSLGVHHLEVSTTSDHHCDIFTNTRPCDPLTTELVDGASVVEQMPGLTTRTLLIRIGDCSIGPVPSDDWAHLICADLRKGVQVVLVILWHSGNQPRLRTSARLNRRLHMFRGPAAARGRTADASHGAKDSRKRLGAGCRSGPDGGSGIQPDGWVVMAPAGPR